MHWSDLVLRTGLRAEAPQQASLRCQAAVAEVVKVPRTR
jgi:hypothetical protein